MRSFFRTLTVRGLARPMNKKALIIGALVGALLIAGIAVAVSLIPTSEEVKKNALESALLPGMPEFDDYTKEIIITTDTNRLQESRTALGDLVMRIGGRIRNKGDKTLSLLEISVGMVDSKNTLIKEKKYMIIPDKHSELGPGETIDVDANLAGFSDGDDRANARWKVTAMKLKD